jgi:hypothetical protein
MAVEEDNAVSTEKVPMSPLPSRSLWLLCLGACLGALLACQGEDAVSDASGTWTSRAFAEGETPTPGWPTQGRLLHGSDLESVSFTNAEFAPKKPIYNLHLDKGELIGELDYERDGGSSLVQACTPPFIGAARDCGYTWQGVGRCTPGVAVHLGAGGCGLGTCSGDPVLRVCSGLQSCLHANALVTGDNGCSGSVCPDVAFTCPSTGTYTVYAGARVSNATTWSVGLVPSSGTFPARRIIQGTELIGARLQGYSLAEPQSPDMLLIIQDVVNASTLADLDRDPSGLTPWDGTGSTFLYRAQMTRGSTTVRCSAAGGGPYSDWMVPVSGVYNTRGQRDTSNPTRFTFGCQHDVISKCYRWGFKPWLGNDLDDVHASCTRMARADYCGEGKPQTENGTHVVFWDPRTPSSFPKPDASAFAPNELFEAGWSRFGAVCLSHARWKTLLSLPPGCNLVAPSLQPTGDARDECQPGEKEHGGMRCPTVCNTPEEALNYQNATLRLRLFNHSAIHGDTDGGTPLDGGGGGGAP